MGKTDGSPAAAGVSAFPALAMSQEAHMPDEQDRATETSSNDAYFPVPSAYDPHISVAQWREILRDPELTTPATLSMLTTMLRLGGEATCVEMARQGGKSPWHYNALGMNFGRRISATRHIPGYTDGDRTVYFVIPFRGRYVSNGDGRKHYAWKLREELQEALAGLKIGPAVPHCSHAGRQQVQKNLILYGPPGTGKTWHTYLYAVAIIEERPLEELKAENPAAVRERFMTYRQQGLIEFTTFHQSYSYEDFIEGIRPVIDEDEGEAEGRIGYRVVDGVFKKFCNQAETETFATSLRGEFSVFGGIAVNPSPVIWKVSLAGTGDNPVRSECLANNHIRIGWDAYGKDITEETDFTTGGKGVLEAFIQKMRTGDIVVSCYSESMTDAIGIVTGGYEWHDGYPAYKRLRKVHWLVKDIRQDILELNNGIRMTLSTVYQLKNINLADLVGILRAHLPAQPPASSSVRRKNRVFIIDEINRGNIAGIFGELITLIEPSKRLGAAEALKVRLPYSRTEFGVPDNVYILGTMNTADRSLTALDIALRRRFAFERIAPEPDLLAGRLLGDSGYTVADLLRTMNRRIAALIDQEHCLGHAPFMKLHNGNVPTSELADIFRHVILPLLEEYFFEDWRKIRLVLNDQQKPDTAHQFVVAADDDADLFGPEYAPAEPGWRLNPTALGHMTSYVQIVDAAATCTETPETDEGAEGTEANGNTPSRGKTSSRNFTPPESLEEAMRCDVLQTVEHNNFIFIKFNQQHYAVYDKEAKTKITNQKQLCRDFVASDPLFRNVELQKGDHTYLWISTLMDVLLHPRRP